MVVIGKADADADGETFGSDVINLSEVDLGGISRLPSSVLRASLDRLGRELANSEDIYAGFQNILGTEPRETAHADSPGRATKAIGTRSERDESPPTRQETDASDS
jgi:FXSXX-COOH protein